MISGAIDDNQNEFNPIKKAIISPHDHLLIRKVSPRLPSTTPEASQNPPAARKKVPRTRRKGQFKLRFHHQALPQEYLEHYEATQNSQQKRDAAKALLKVNKAVPVAVQNSQMAAMEVEDQNQESRTHDSVRNWLQKISEFQSDPSSVIGGSQCPKGINIKHESEGHVGDVPTGNAPAKKSARVVSYSDLPYMGEMTLDNSKPRRGRKPKKADICHLIYKNYGTILPGTPKELMENHNRIVVHDSVNVSAPTLVRIDLNAASSDLQSKLIESLLEKRLTNDNSRTPTVTPSTVGRQPSPSMTVSRLQAEPLNLCVRDESQETFTVESSDEESSSAFASSRNSPYVANQSDTDSTLASNLKMSLPNFQTAMLDQPAGSFLETPSTGDSTSNAPNGFGYWPNGTFINPMALYYQKMVDVSNPGANPNMMSPPLAPSTPSTGRTSTPAVSPMPSITSMPSPSPPSAKREPVAKILIPKNISQLLKQQDTSSPTRQSSAASDASSTCSSKSVSVTPAHPPKRKRSAIFIPPMPVESSTNHATEVSICKFKFTGGAKPSLQEKKMLSVDAGGNFRYYSGTGDKSMRGYEFFPRESLQQSSLMAASSAGAFLNTPGEKMNLDLSPPSLGLSNEVLQIPELPSPTTVSAIQPHLMSNQLPHLPNAMSQHQMPCPSPSAANDATLEIGDRRKRKSRRSLQRENLEKTFKEKGFLIQTQQLESAEGATYCKFRQLRKFTRYLFRSWKDYLPGDLQQGPNGMVAANAIDPAQMLMSTGHMVGADGEVSLHQLSASDAGHHSSMLLELPVATGGSIDKSDAAR